jgi:hypothetical protein
MGRAAVDLMVSQLAIENYAGSRHEVLKVTQHYVDRGTVRRIS